jgi:hypothetical protein
LPIVHIKGFHAEGLHFLFFISNWIRHAIHSKAMNPPILLVVFDIMIIFLPQNEF